FHREAEVRRLTAQAVRDALLKYHAGEGATASGPMAELPAKIGQAAGHDPVAPEPAQVNLPHLPPELRPAPPPSAPVVRHQPALKMGFGQGRPLYREPFVEKPPERSDSAASPGSVSVDVAPTVEKEQ